MSICTGNVSHESLVLAAAEAGKNILCEKPMAISVEQAENMRRAVEKNNVTFMMAFVNRFSGRRAYCSRNCSVRADSARYTTRAVAGYAAAARRAAGSRTDRKSGGGRCDIGVHVIDLTWYLMADLGRYR